MTVFGGISHLREVAKHAKAKCNNIGGEFCVYFPWASDPNEMIQ